MKDTFIVHTSLKERFKSFSKEQFGELFLCMLEYQATGEEPEISDPMVELAFNFVRVDMDSNNEKYEAICEKRREAGRNGGTAKAKKSSNSKACQGNLASVANASKSKQEVANLANASKPSKTYQELASVADNDNENDNDVFINKNNKKERVEKKSNDFSPPAYEDVLAYCHEHKLRIDTKTFFEYYQSQGWRKSRGQKIKDWKACVRAWESREASYPRANKSTVEKVLDFEAAKDKQGRGS